MESLQQPLSVLLVLGLLGGTLWWLRTRGMAQFGRRGQGGRTKRLRSLERLSLTPQHSLHIVEVEGKTVLIATSPGGCSILEGGSGARTEAQ